MIAAEKNVTAARRLIAAFAKLGRMLVVPPVVIVEARQRSASPGAVDDILGQLDGEPHTPTDGRRASDLLRKAGKQAASQGIDASERFDILGTADALVAAMAERVGGIVYIADPRHTWNGCETPEPRSPPTRFRSLPAPIIEATKPAETGTSQSGH